MSMRRLEPSAAAAVCISYIQYVIAGKRLKIRRPHCNYYTV